jgi:glycosyltransferase 2 family protein
MRKAESGSPDTGLAAGAPSRPLTPPAKLSLGRQERIFGPMSRPRPSTWLKAIVFLALAFLILRNADLGRVGAHLGRIPAAAYILAFAAMLASLALQALRWKLLLKDPAIPYRECYACIGVGSSLAMVSPSSLLADGAVGYWLGRRRQGVLRALSALLAARVLGVAAGVILLLAALPSHLWVFRELRLEGTSRRALAAAALALVFAAAAALAWRYRDKLAQLVDRALPILKDPLFMGVAMALSLGVQLVQIAAHWIAYRALGAPIAYSDLLFFLPLITLLAMVPISLGGMGVREGLGIFFFTMLPGVGREAVLAEAGFRYLLMAAMAAVNIVVAWAVLGGLGRRSARS